MHGMPWRLQAAQLVCGPSCRAAFTHSSWHDCAHAWPALQPIPCCCAQLRRFADGAGAGSGMETMWDDFGDQMEALGANVPWMLTNGNHERCVSNTATASEHLLGSTNQGSALAAGVPLSKYTGPPEPHN